MNEQPVIFPCQDFKLEGVLGMPDGDGPFPAVVVCHPHPQMGGSMNNNVVFAACRALTNQSIAALRFNFRGVGKSGGFFAEGIGEQEDVKVALDYLSSLHQIDASRMGLCGYSFGTMVGIPVTDSDDRVQTLAAVSPFFTEPGLLQNYHKPKLFIAGTRDGFIDSSELESAIAKLPGPKKLEIISGADHFWGGFENHLEEILGKFFRISLTD